MTTRAPASRCCSSPAPVARAAPGTSTRCRPSSPPATAASPSTTAASAPPRTPTASPPSRWSPTPPRSSRAGRRARPGWWRCRWAAFIAQELMLARPELVSQAVLMGTRGRIDRTRESFRVAEQAAEESGIELPAELSPRKSVCWRTSHRETINDEHVGHRLDRHVHRLPAQADAGLAGTADRRPAGQPAAGLPRHHHPGAGDRLRRRRHHPAGAGTRGGRSDPERAATSRSPTPGTSDSSNGRRRSTTPCCSSLRRSMPLGYDTL